MGKAFEDILRQPELSREDIKVLLAAEGERKTERGEREKLDCDPDRNLSRP